MIRVLAFLGAFAVLNALAQAPTEERVLQDRNPVGQGQQRLGFLNRGREAAQEKVNQAEQDLREATDIEGSAQQRLDSVKKQKDVAAAALERARQELAVARKAYDQEAAEFERTLKATQPADAGKAAKK
jgi:chromosome segregation ATPase